jgi:hypothetical protein
MSVQDQGEESKEFDYILSRIHFAVRMFKELELEVMRVLSVWPQYWKEGRAVPDEIRSATRAALINLVSAITPEIPDQHTVLKTHQYDMKEIREERNRQIRERAKEYTDRGMLVPIAVLAREFRVSTTGVDLIIGRRYRTVSNIKGTYVDEQVDGSNGSGNGKSLLTVRETAEANVRD